ncbi:flavin-containing monooxygenase [Brachybacterium saurashtrense]|uniref:NAD(P)/FAD-dependent oxidoreductase n=1 Tax=Brachybacterium saurashtrense TaxID=556288 RepID=A0A345YPY5_9MICO|nr:NAD(P)-binding domain-containing protein [Brachybacterium saurashtrense]AXK45987.1 NAD(P)/FAD-dependent oxidoreductase [Brachybacterium saurashtrense]RRR23726.1 NAD(P)/FAD-dependent oxidoreductase [Brachybacterium saurashtrense]
MPAPHDTIPTREKVLIIGAGPAGLAAAAALTALEVPFDMVDRAPHVGGIWDPERADSPVWPTLEMISSREFTQYEDLLQPVSFPEYLSPAQMGKYLRAYAARHDLTEHFRPRTAVRTARPFDEGVWEVELSTGEVGIYRAVISAHGISQRPHRPAWASEVPSSVRVIHSSEWTGADGLEGQRVLVVGSGQSAADISVDAARRALEVRWSMRTGHWVVPRRIAGMPGDVAASREPSLLGGLNARIAEAVVRRTVGDPVEAGLPAPAAPLLEDAVIVSDDVLDRVREGRITPAGEVTGVDADGRITHRATGAHAGHQGFSPDLIVLATGYETGADHLPAGVVPRTAGGELDLFLGAFARGRDDLVILGQQRVSGGVLPILVEQADIAAYMLAASREGSSPALERFRRLRAGAETAIPAAPAPAPSGVRGRVEGLLGAQKVTARRAAATSRDGEEQLVPQVDRDTLLARLRSVRELFA